MVVRPKIGSIALWLLCLWLIACHTKPDEPPQPSLDYGYRQGDTTRFQTWLKTSLLRGDSLVNPHFKEMPIRENFSSKKEIDEYLNRSKKAPLGLRFMRLSLRPTETYQSEVMLVSHLIKEGEAESVYYYLFPTAELIQFVGGQTWANYYEDRGYVREAEDYLKKCNNSYTPDYLRVYSPRELMMAKNDTGYIWNLAGGLWLETLNELIGNHPSVQNFSQVDTLIQILLECDVAYHFHSNRSRIVPLGLSDLDSDKGPGWARIFQADPQTWILPGQREHLRLEPGYIAYPWHQSDSLALLAPFWKKTNRLIYFKYSFPKHRGMHYTHQGFFNYFAVFDLDYQIDTRGKLKPFIKAAYLISPKLIMRNMWF